MKPAISILLAECCVLAPAACGGSSAKAGHAAADPQLNMSECMRAHGVPNHPDPVFPPGGGIEWPSAPG